MNSIGRYPLYAHEETRWKFINNLKYIYPNYIESHFLTLYMSLSASTWNIKHGKDHGVCNPAEPVIFKGFIFANFTLASRESLSPAKT